MIAVTRRCRMAGLALCAAVAVVGCASVSVDAQNSSLEALATQAPAPKDYVAPKKKVSCAGLFESLPAGALPPPGRMPVGSYMDRIRARGKLKVGVDQNTLRLGHFNPKTRVIEGFDIDLARAVTRAIFGTSKKRIVFKAISTAQRASAIRFEDVDIVASAFSIECKRLRSMYFSSVYYTAQQKLLVPEDSTVDSLSKLRNLKVCATKGSTSITNLEGTGVVAHPVQLRPDCLVELQEGRVAAITSDDSILFGYRLQDPQTKIVGDCIHVERYGLAINRRHPEFVRFVNGVLKRLGPAGLERIRRRWLHGLKAPTRDEISRCGRRADRRDAQRAVAKLRAERQAPEFRARWRRQLTAPTAAEIARCDGRCG